MVVDHLTSLLGQFALDRATGLSLADGRSVDRVAMWSDILNFKTDDVAAAELTIDRKIEQHQASFSICDLKARADGPDVLWLERRICTGQPALFQGVELRGSASRNPISMVALLSAKSEERAAVGSINGTF